MLQAYDMSDFSIAIASNLRRIRVVDTHTEGEPTRVIIEGGPELEPASARDQLDRLRHHHDDLRAIVVREPRGADPVVGAWLGPPSIVETVAQVIFFNNVGYLGMCVHGTIGVARALQHLGRVGCGSYRLETPVGVVGFTTTPSGMVVVENVLSFRARAGVEVATERHGTVRGEIAYGGNWFFLVSDCELALVPENVETLTDLAWDVRCSLARAGITGTRGEEIDHVELFGPPARADADSKNFVLCPGKQYDRSPCGTGLSAKLACLAAAGKLAEGEVWRQESIIGSLFAGSVRFVEGGVIPTLWGRAFVTAEATLVVEPGDPFPVGIGW